MARIDLYQLDDFADDFAPNKVDGSVPLWDGVNEQFTPSTSMPNKVLYHNQPTDVSTTGTTFVTQHTHTFTALPAGLYKLSWMFTFWTSSGSSMLEVRVRAGSTDLYPVNFYESNGSSSSNFRGIRNAWQYYNHAGGDLTMTLELRRQESFFGTVYVVDSTFEAMKIIA
jgi:hypothetical protein